MSSIAWETLFGAYTTNPSKSNLSFIARTLNSPQSSADDVVQACRLMCCLINDKKSKHASRVRDACLLALDKVSFEQCSSVLVCDQAAGVYAYLHTPPTHLPYIHMRRRPMVHGLRRMTAQMLSSLQFVSFEALQTCLAACMQESYNAEWRAEGLLLQARYRRALGCWSDARRLYAKYTRERLALPQTSIFCKDLRAPVQNDTRDTLATRIKQEVDEFEADFSLYDMLVGDVEKSDPACGEFVAPPPAHACVASPAPSLADIREKLEGVTPLFFVFA
jgi:hypothetical protein